MANRKGASRTERRSDHYYTVVQERARETKRPVRRPLDVLDHIPRYWIRDHPTTTRRCYCLKWTGCARALANKVVFIVQKKRGASISTTSAPDAIHLCYNPTSYLGIHYAQPRSHSNHGVLVLMSLGATAKASLDLALQLYRF